MLHKSGKILVIGATGRIGAVLRHYWPAADVVWQSRRPQSGFVCFDPLPDAVAFAQAARPCTAILCLAGVVVGRDGDDGFEANITLALASVRAAAATGIPVYLASSAAVYGNQPGILAESARLDPINDYGRAKVQMERQAAALGRELDVPVCSLRIGNIAGLDAILGGWRPGFRLDRFEDGTTPARSYLGVRTLADVLWDVVTTPECPAVVNIANPGVVEMGALLDAAGLDWSARPAGETAIPRVELDVTELGRISARAGQAGHPDRLVRQWQAFNSGEAVS